MSDTLNEVVTPTAPEVPAEPVQEPTVSAAEHEIIRRKMTRFRAALKDIVKILDQLTDDEQHDIIRS